MRSIPRVLVAVLAAAVLGGVLDGRAWPGAALALFRPQLSLALLASALLAFLVLRPLTGALGLAVAALGLALLVPSLVADEPAAPPGGATTARVLVLNLWSRNDDASAVSALIREQRADAVALLELTPAWARALAPALRSYPVRAAVVREGSSGIGLYGRRSLLGPAPVALADGAPPGLAARLRLPGGTVARLLLVHPPGPLTPGRDRLQRRMLDAASAWAKRAPGRSLVCGDFNAAPWSRALREAASDARLRVLLPGGPWSGSWPGLPAPLRIPVDGCLVGERLQARGGLAESVGSDHVPVVVELR